MIQVHFWGTRGSLPASITASAVRKKVLQAIKRTRSLQFESDEDVETFIDSELPFSIRGTYGSNTSCLEIKGGDEYLLCDAGTGLRDFGNYVMQGPDRGQKEKQKIFHIFLSHLHWDHIQGFPFFTPAYLPGARVNVYGFHEDLEKIFVNQQNPPCFPVPLSVMKADIRFTVLETGKEYQVGDVRVKGWQQNHPGDSFGYLFEKDGKRIVYSTDSEHIGEVDEEDYPFLTHFRDADLLIFDAQYALLDALYMKENWGHSSNIIGVELSVKARVKHLCLFHNEPTTGDERLDQFLEETRRYLEIYADSYPLKIDIAYDGLEIEV